MEKYSISLLFSAIYYGLTSKTFSFPTKPTGDSFFKVHTNKKIVLEKMGILAFLFNIFFHFICYQIIWVVHSPSQWFFFFNSYYVQDKVNTELTFMVLEVWQSRKVLGMQLILNRAQAQ